MKKLKKMHSGAVVSTVDKDGNKNNFECDVVLISVGRKPNIRWFKFRICRSRS